MEILGDVATEVDKVCTNKIRIVRELSQKEIVEVLAEQSTEGRTALLWATIEGHKEIVKVLIEAGATVNAKDICGRTALIYAEATGHKEIEELLTNANEASKTETNKTETTSAALIYERHAHSKFTNGGLFEAVSTLTEEVGVFAQAVNNNETAKVKEEALKIITVCIRILEGV